MAPRVTQPWRNKRFVSLDRHVERIGKRVTKKPVYLGLVDRIPYRNGRDDRKAAASVIRRRKPDEYQVVIRKSFFRENQKNPAKLKKIAAHEVAHIAYDTHGPAWQRTAKRLGAAEYATERGTLKPRKKR